MDQQALQSQFLSHFGKPLTILLDEKGIPVDYYKNSKISKSGLKTLIECTYINKSQPFSVNFTPNGNYGSKVKGMASGSPLSGIRNKKEPGTSPYINSICLDCDYKYYDGTPAEFLDEILKLCGQYKIVPSFINETVTPGQHGDNKFGGYHIYFVINPEDRERVQDHYANDMFPLMSFMNKLFPGYDDSDMVLSSTIRLPLTNHWKYCEPSTDEGVWGKPNGHGRLLYGFVNDNNLLSFEKWQGEPVHMIRYADIESVVKYMNDSRVGDQEYKQMQKNYGNKDVDNINQLSFVDIINRLQRYPRQFKGQTQIFSIENDRVLINGEINNGYRYREKENVFNCFSGTHHSRDERPCGKPIHFLSLYFYKDRASLCDFLMKEYGINLTAQNVLSDGESVELQIHSNGEALMFTQNRIMLQTQGAKEPKITPLLKQPLTYKGSIKTKLNIDKFSEAEKFMKSYIFDKEGEQFVLSTFPDKKSFNRVYAHNGLHFFGTDNDLGTFYLLLDKSDVPEFVPIERDGYYGDYIIHGGNIIGVGPDKSMNYMHDTMKFPLQGGTVLIQEFMNGLNGQFDPKIGVPVMLQTIAMAGMNFWQTGDIGPQVLLTGITGSGKTTLYKCMKAMLGIPLECREETIQTTADALMKMSTGGSILRIEEITGEAKNKNVEETLRNVINKSKISKGRLSGTIQYTPRSPVFGLGERVFSGESLNNRFTMFIMDQKLQVGSKEGVKKLMKFTAWQHIYNTYLNLDPSSAAKTHSEHVRWLQEQGMSPRYSNLRGYAFAVNELFEIGIDKLDLRRYVRYNFERSGANVSSAGLMPHIVIRNIVLEYEAKRQVTCVIREDAPYRVIEFIFIDKSFQQVKPIVNSKITEMIEANPQLADMIYVTYNGFQVRYRADSNMTNFDTAVAQQFGAITECMNKFSIKISKPGM